MIKLIADKKRKQKEEINYLEFLK